MGFLSVLGEEGDFNGEKDFLYFDKRLVIHAILNGQPLMDMWKSGGSTLFLSCPQVSILLQEKLSLY